MSTKTTIKRIALVAVAALGFGMLSSVPSSAAASAVTVTVADGTSTNSTDGYVSDSTTAGLITVSALLETRDSITVQIVQKSKPSTSTNAARLYFIDSTTVQANSTVVETATAVAAASGQAATKWTAATDGFPGVAAGADFFRVRAGSAAPVYVGAKFGIQLDSATARIAGTYTYTAVVKVYNNEGTTGVAASTLSYDLSVVVPADVTTAAATNGTIDPSKTTAVLNAGAPTTFSSTDSSVAVVATASATNHASIQVKTYTSASLAAPESVTVTLTGAGVVCNSDGTVCGNNLTITGAGGDNTFRVRANGTAGTASIVVKTTTKTFPAKVVSFYAKSPKTITVSTNKPVISVAAASSNTDVVRAVAKDADGIVWGGQLYIIASAAADALIAGSATTPTACTFNSTYGFHACPLKGTAKGTASVKVMDASLDTDGTIATTDAAVTSDATSVRVSTGTASSVKIAFDKATYAPGDKAYVWISVLDENGDAMPAGTIANVFASAPTANVAWGAGTTATFSTSVAIEGATDAATDTNAGAQTYVVYMPQATGTVTLSGTGSTGLAASGRVAVSASAEVVNESVTAAVDAANDATEAANAATDAANAAAEAADAATAAAQDAQAAVADLAAQVATLISGIKAQITRLTNLVIKIQKKVNA